LQIYISHSQLATQLSCGGIWYQLYYILQNEMVKFFLKSVNVWRRYGQKIVCGESVALL